MAPVQSKPRKIPTENPFENINDWNGPKSASVACEGMSVRKVRQTL